ncbi:MAG: hypothetical protein JO219_03270 [Candidatus Eremiobacteraeota bacterium]|nr:hypothetical protein [Candidatus Eremiobacteraeota bacterium]
MQLRALLPLVALCLAALGASAPPTINPAAVKLTPPPAGSQALYARLYPHVPARLQPWLENRARALAFGQSENLNWPSADDPMLAGLNLSNSDIEALTFIVLMQATQNADQDLKSIMAQVQAVNKEKQQLRNELSQVQNVPPSPSPRASTPAGKTHLTKAQLQDLLEELDDMTEMQSLRLQLAMDRRSKFIETLSNIMKKIESTQETLLQNMK